MDAVVRKLLREAGTTYAEEAGIPLKDQPAALFKLLVLANLLSARISGDIAVAAARELFEAGGGTPRGMARLTWQERVDALGRGRYVRYDESTSDRLGNMAEMVQDKYGGDLRRLPRDSERDIERARELVCGFPGIGATGADIFFREAQAVWPWLRPYFDGQTLKGAERFGLPQDPKRLADLVTGKDLARFAAALVAPITAPARTVAALEKQTGRPYNWTDRARAVADRLVLTARVDEIAQQDAALLLVSGSRDRLVRTGEITRLRDLLVERGARTVEAATFRMSHALAAEPGVDACPPTTEAVSVDGALTDWFREHLAVVGKETRPTSAAEMTGHAPLRLEGSNLETLGSLAGGRR